MESDINEAFTAYADTLQALSRGDIGFGHSKSYHKKDYFAQAEFFAHAMENRFLGNPLFEQLDKSLYDEMIKMVERITRGKWNLTQYKTILRSMDKGLTN